MTMLLGGGIFLIGLMIGVFLGAIGLLIVALAGH